MKRLLGIAMVGAGIICVYFVGYTRFYQTEGNNILIEETQAQIENIFSAKAEFFADDGVVKVSFPRKDSNITIDEWPLDPFMGLTSWVAFQKGTKKGIEIMAMGDFALLQEEVNPIMNIALEHDIQITALHNHFFYSNPSIYFMHLEAEGTISAVAGGIKKMIDALHNIRPTNKLPLPTTHAISADLIEKIIPVKGTLKDGMFKIVIGRHIYAGCGCMVGKNMGVNTWAAFGGTDDNAIVDGDFAVLEDELQAVLKALQEAHIDIVAIHNHMINEKPRMMFLHYWGRGTATNLAQGIKHALDATSTHTLKNSKIESHTQTCCNTKKST